MSARRQSSLVLLPGDYAVCRLPPGTAVAAAGDGLFSVTHTPAETSIVCREPAAPDAARVEAGWRVLEVAGPLDFSEVGVLASLAEPLAAAEVAIFVLSTWDTDYLLVKSQRLDAACAALAAAGFAVRGENSN